jgi:uncharacterized SAM-binding protein YcdF (DUF218 family)
MEGGHQWLIHAGFLRAPFSTAEGVDFMWIELSKILPYLVYPLTITLLLLASGVLLRMFGARRTGGVCLALSLVVLLASSNPWLAKGFRAQLEQWYTPFTAADAPHVDAIVLLGGALHLPLPPRVDAELSDAADRVLYTSRLYRAGKASRIVVTGGNVFDQGDGVRGESFYIAELLREWGVPARAIVIEEHSRNTRQNALETKKILDRSGHRTILLVTSALHMPRALATFKGAGIEAIPAPVDFSVSSYRYPVALDLLPSAGALYINTQTLREYLGIVVYGFQGWFAAPGSR